MSAKLEWRGARLFLGRWPLAQARHDIGKRGEPKRCDFIIYGEPHLGSDRYESITDCMQDCESAVRRLLKEAGVEVEP